MSLINEALKRARQESRRREALTKGLPLAPPTRPVQHRSWLTAAVVAMALALLVSLLTIARLATDQKESAATEATATQPREARPSEREVATTSSTAAPGESEPTAAPSPPTPGTASTPVPGERQAEDSADSEPESAAEARSVVEPTPTRQAFAEPEASPVTSSSSLVGLAQPPARGVRLVPDGETTPDEDGAPTQNPAQPRIFVEKMTLASGDTLELGGIAWSATGPYALLDQRVVGLGETIKGYMVTRIAPQEVELEGSDGTILLRLK